MDIDTTSYVESPWRTEFDRIIAEARRRAFVWGQHDCCTFAAACWSAITGENALQGLAWSSEAEAAEVLSRFGGLQAAVTARIGAPSAPMSACAGDLAIVVDPHGAGKRELLAVCLGPFHVAPGARGLSVFSLQSAVCAWKA